MYIAILIVALGILFIPLYYLWIKRKEYLLSFKLNGPMAYPIIGNGAHFLGDTSQMVTILPKLTKRYGTPMRLWFGPKLLVFFAKPDDVQKIISSSKMAYKQHIYDVLQTYVGDGLISSFGGPKYRKHKKILQPLFNLKYISENFEIYEREINTMLQILEKHTDGKTFDVHEYIHCCFAEIIGETFLGIKFDAQRGKSKDFFRAVKLMYTYVYERATKPWLKLDLIYYLTFKLKQQHRLLNYFDEFFENVISKSRRRIENNKNKHSLTTPIVDQINQIVMDDPDSISSKDFVHHLFTLYLASEDTVTLIASTLCLCFGMYPEYQKLAFEEIRNVIGEERAATYDDIQNLIYLDMCVRDILRVMPIAPFILRKSLEDFEIDNLVIPESTSVGISIFDLHRDPNIWENPDHFYPDHFLPEAVEKRHPYAYIPFSSGARGCIGRVFATVTLKLLMAKILQKFEIEADGKLPDIVLRNDISVRSLHGYKIRLKKRFWN